MTKSELKQLIKEVISELTYGTKASAAKVALQRGDTRGQEMHSRISDKIKFPITLYGASNLKWLKNYKITADVSEIKDVSLFGSHIGSVTSHFDLVLSNVNVVTRGDEIDQGILSDLKKIKVVKLTIDEQGKSIVPSVPYHVGYNLKLSREDATTLANNINSLYPKKERITANDIDYTRETW